jgi:hypothetical protein
LGVAACAVLYHGSRFARRCNTVGALFATMFLECRIAGQHSLCLHDGGSYFG